MPSTMSTSVSSDLFSSTVMTPSLPTFCIACAIILPMAASPLEEIVPTWAISDDEATGLARFSRSLTTAVTALSMPRFRSIGFMPAATYLAPSRTIAWARTVAVVVPSPALSLVLEATSRTICAPMFSNLSSSSISLATVTPSLVMRGAPNDLSSTTLRPLGPRVTRTAWASVSMPRSILSRASTENFTSLAAMLATPSGGFIGSSFVERVFRRHLGMTMRCEKTLCGLLPGHGLDQHAHDIALLHDQEFGAVDLDLGARPFAEHNPVTRLDVDRDDPAGFGAPAGADGDDLALAGLFLGGIGDDDAASGLVLGFDALDDNTIV